MSKSYDIKRFVGDFRARNEFGKVKVYIGGDVVLYKGIKYLAIRNTSGYSPLHGERGGWEPLDSTVSMNFINSDTEPETPTEGDHWFDSSTGNLFIYLKDKDTEQWVQL